MLGTAPADASVEFSDVLAIDNVNVIDLSRSPNYRKGHIPGAWFAIRSRLDRALPNIPLRKMIVLTSEDGVLAGLAVEEARALTDTPGALAQGRQRRLGRRRISALDRRQDWRTSRSTSGSSPTSGRATRRPP